MLMTSHFYRIHTSYTIITVSTVAACLFFLLHPVHESRFVEQSSRHLHGIKTGIEHFIYFLTGNKTTDIINGASGRAARNFSASSRK